MMACGGFLLSSGALLFSLLAVLASLQLECYRERDERVRGQVFQPGLTEVVDLPLCFCTQGRDQKKVAGIDSILESVTPCAVTRVMAYLGIIEYEKCEDVHNVTIHDARKTQINGFHESGFTLIELEEDVQITDWRTNAAIDKTAEINKFYQQMEPHLRKLYPETKRIKWTSNIVRGGDKLGDHPPLLGIPHLDFHPNNTERVIFHDSYPNPTSGGLIPEFETNLLMGSGDSAEDSLRVLLGVWKPLHPAAVCDLPLAVMDAATFQQEQLQRRFLHINFGVFTYHNLNGAISYSPSQNWAYYSFQTAKEVLIFHHYSKDRWMVNPHTSFSNRNCPPGTEARVSVEIRVALYY